MQLTRVNYNYMTITAANTYVALCSTHCTLLTHLILIMRLLLSSFFKMRKLRNTAVKYLAQGHIYIYVLCLDSNPGGQGS